MTTPPDQSNFINSNAITTPLVNDTTLLVKPLPKPRLLIADDNATDRFLLETILRKQGYEVLVASDGQEAVEIFDQHRPDIVLLDALMPRMDGFEAAPKIKALAGEEFVPIIFLTSLQDADSLARCLDAGGDDFLSKPYKGIILKAKINAFSRMREMHRTLQYQRDQIAAHNVHLLREQEVAKRVFDKVAHAGCLDADNIKYALSPIAIFNGDVALAGVSPSGDLVVLLGDFTGHGLDAAIGAMPLAQTFYSMLEKGFALKDILREINLKLDEILPIGVFCCALVADIDFKSGTVRVWNGGLPDCVIYRPATGNITRLPSRHLPLGIHVHEKFNDDVEIYNVEVGDRLFIWSDGIHEAEDDSGKMFGEQRLMDVFAANNEPEKLFTELNVAVNSYIAEGSAGDDISLIEVEIVPAHAFKVDRPKFVGGQQVGPKDWSLCYQLRTETLKDFDPLPLLLHVLMQVPFLRSFGGQIYTVLVELYSNALEHGVLGLDSSLKKSHHGFSEYYLQRQQRLEALESGEIEITLNYKGTVSGGRLLIAMTDSGVGFDVQAILQAVNEDTGYSGRGIHLLRSLCHSVDYAADGKTISVTFVWGDHAAIKTANPG